MAGRPARKTKLTELCVRKLKPEVRAYLVWDTHQRGLAIRMQPSGSKAWMCVYSYRGRPRWYHLGGANAIGLAAARKLTAEVMLDVIRGKDPAAEKRAERGAGTVAELAERYVEQYAKRHNKSWSQPDRLVRRYLLPKWGKLQAIFLRSSVRDASIVAKGTSACGFRTVRVGKRNCARNAAGNRATALGCIALRGIGSRRAIAAIGLRIGRHYPNGHSQNARVCDARQSALHH
jgi:hypothetical protein